MNDLTKLTEKGQHHNLQFPAAMREQFIKEAGFTDREIEILNYRARGKSILEISFMMNCSVETINKCIRRIKDKIAYLVNEQVV